MQPGQQPQGPVAPPGHPSQGYGAPPGQFPPHGGYPPPRRGLPGWGIALIVVGSVILVLGLLVAISFPAFQKYRQKAKTTEAPENIKRIFDGAKTYYESGGGEAVERTGAVTIRFPGPVELTPENPCCKGSGGRCRQTDWDHPSWKALGFSLTEPHYFQYRFQSQGMGKEASFTAGAHADLDCDGVFSTFERTGRVDESNLVVGSHQLYIEGELE